MKHFKIIAYLISVTLSFSVYGQELEVLKPQNSDCRGAIFLEDTVFGPTTAAPGPGEIMEISSEGWSKYAFQREHHTVWYEFVAPEKSVLSLTIIPESVEDDYDFLLYRKTGKEFCKKIKQQKVDPARSNISRNNTQKGSRTGLRQGARNTHVPPGPGDDFSKAVEVEKGDTLLLVVDNVYKGGEGHRLQLHYDYLDRPETQPEPGSEEEVQEKEPEQQLLVTIRDKETKNMTNADILLSYDRSQNALLEKQNVSHFRKKLEPNADYRLVISKDKYFKESIKLSSPETDTTIRLEVGLTKIEKGRKLTLRNVYFYSNSASFLRDSYETLRNLLSVMQEHPGLKIAIYGHVNQPLQWKQRSSDESLQKLSERRAEAVKRYLTQRGIDQERIITEGISNREMIYPYAETEEEQSKNRRVEIKVLEI
ncbi:MAG: OmpA family protein [Bacteroidales bacterium]